jgi:threonine dehydratase
MLTPQKSHAELAKSVGLSGALYLKREDLHPYGSHKGRSIPVMIDEYLRAGSTHFVVSSSGNAALAAALYIRQLNEGREEKIKLDILVGMKITKHKLDKLMALSSIYITISKSERPLQTLATKTADGTIRSLRQSLDDTALIGYEPLASELSQIKDLQAIFIATSSGTTAEALAQYFLKEKKSPEIHIVQTTSCHPMAETFVDSMTNDDHSIADAIVDTVGYRKKVLVPLVGKSGGSGWIATNGEIKSAQELIHRHAQIEVSPNGALALAGLIQATFTGREWTGPVVCIIGGE